MSFCHSGPPSALIAASRFLFDLAIKASCRSAHLAFTTIWYPCHRTLATTSTGHDSAIKNDPSRSSQSPYVSEKQINHSATVHP